MIKFQVYYENIYLSGEVFNTGKGKENGKVGKAQPGG